MNKKIAQIVVGLPVEGPFDYLIPDSMRDKIQTGMRVRVLFNRRRIIGFVTGFKDKSNFQNLNSIIALLEDKPSLDKKALEFCKKISENYGAALGEAIEIYLPLSIRKGSFADIAESKKTIKEPDAQYLQQKNSYLLYGFDDQKKWEFIFDKIKSALSAEKQVIILVPEMLDIERSVKKIKTVFNEEIAAFDKTVSGKNELGIWLKIKQGTIPIVAGTRSAVFAPAPNLGLIVLFNEENDAYKQEQVPHYHARGAALIRQEIDNCAVIFTSVAPSAEIWHESKNKNWKRIYFEPVFNNEVQFVDMTNYNPKSSILSFPLQNNIKKFLDEKKKIILLMNRRGFSTITQCNQCGNALKCPRCDVNLTYIYSKKIMACRHCNFTMELPKICPACNGSYLRSLGMGIEKLESETARYYPQAKVSSFDKDTNVLMDSADIIIATQAILKILKDIKVDLIALVDFDSSINQFNFRSANKTFSLLLHFKEAAREKLLIQTKLPDNYCLKNFKNLDFEKFYKQELKLRKELNLPPYSHLISVIIWGKKEETVLEQANEIFSNLKESSKDSFEICDLNPDVNPKLRDNFRYRILLKGRPVKGMLGLIKKSIKEVKRRRGVVMSVDVD